jgi:DNA-binding response OmpR family regulator
LLLAVREDAWAIAMSECLPLEGFDVVLGLQALAGSDLVIVDITAPDAVQTCAVVRAMSGVPILAVGAPDEPNIASALSAGADSFAPKTTSPREMAARLRALLRRPPLNADPDGDGVIVHGDLRLDRATRRAWIGDQSLALAASELAILESLLAKPGRVVSREELVRRSGESRGALDQCVRRLRNALELHDATRRIAAVRGVGFRFETSEEVQ